MTKTKQHPTEVAMTSERARMVRKAVLLQNHGTPAAQKDALVEDIITAFSDPRRWPMTDRERIYLIRKWHEMAQTIRATERA